VRLASLSEARTAVEKFDLATPARAGAWTPAQTLVHCAQSLEYALTGFPRNRAWLFRAIVGRIALAKFLRAGEMHHDVAAAIPGAPVPEALAPAAARDRLLAAIDAFTAHAGAFPIHFVYGAVDKTRYDRIQAMHIADHLTRL